MEVYPSAVEKWTNDKLPSWCPAAMQNGFNETWFSKTKHRPELASIDAVIDRLRCLRYSAYCPQVIATRLSSTFG